MIVVKMRKRKGMRATKERNKEKKHGDLAFDFMNE